MYTSEFSGCLAGRGASRSTEAALKARGVLAKPGDRLMASRDSDHNQQQQLEWRRLRHGTCASDAVIFIVVFVVSQPAATSSIRTMNPSTESRPAHRLSLLSVVLPPFWWLSLNSLSLHSSSAMCCVWKLSSESRLFCYLSNNALACDLMSNLHVRTACTHAKLFILVY